MEAELHDLIEHFERYRAVTLQALGLVSDQQLAWRPARDYYSLCQQFIHIAQAEDFQTHGLFARNWDFDRVRLPRTCWKREQIQAYFSEVRTYTLSQLQQLNRAQLDEKLEIPGTPGTWSLRSWLWFVLEHELHHKGQIWVYLRQIGITPPFYAMPLQPGERPDIAAREKLGGF
jgi:uncharacterized damage-inducible protein DinB